MNARLKCRFCDWESKPYDHTETGGYHEQHNAAKSHIKARHKIHWNFWAIKGRVVGECFKVIVEESA